MKPILLSLGAMALLAGCADRCVTPVPVGQCVDDQIYENITRYGNLPPRLTPVSQTQLAMARRSVAYNRQQEISAFESNFYTASEARPSGILAGAIPCPPPQQVIVPGYGPPPPQIIVPDPALSPAPVADCPMGSPVLGKPGYVTSPYAPKAGYVDITGMAPGSLVKDPYTGKSFRIP